MALLIKYEIVELVDIWGHFELSQSTETQASGAAFQEEDEIERLLS